MFTYTKNEWESFCPGEFLAGRVFGCERFWPGEVLAVRRFGWERFWLGDLLAGGEVLAGSRDGDMHSFFYIK